MLEYHYALRNRFVALRRHFHPLAFTRRLGRHDDGFSAKAHICRLTVHILANLSDALAINQLGFYSGSHLVIIQRFKRLTAERCYLGVGNGDLAYTDVSQASHSLG